MLLASSSPDIGDVVSKLIPNFWAFIIQLTAFLVLFFVVFFFLFLVKKTTGPELSSLANPPLFC